MVKELQDLVWSILPKEFKEEVKKLYVEIEVELSKKKGVTDNRTWQYRGMKSQLVCLFGAHNLTSDAEGEVVLTVSRKRVQEVYKTSKEIVNNELYSTCQYSMHTQIMCVLENLFGTKCLPDKVADEDNFASKEPKPAEPKYHRGEKVCYNGYVYEVDGLVGKNRYALKGLNFDVDEDMIEPYEPYTEPLSQNSTENCDNESHISTECDKGARPKYHKGNMVHCLSFGYEGDYKVLEYAGGPSKCYDCIDRNGYHFRFYESDLEPYTEPREDLIPSNSGELKSQVADSQPRNLSRNIENFDKSNCNRLTIAAMAMQGILSNAERMKQYGEIAAREPESLTELVARNALRYADALIDKVKKGVNNE